MLLPFADRDIPNLEKIMRKISLPRIEPSAVSHQTEEWIVNEIVSANKKGGVIGLSGGIDSSTVACLAKCGFDCYNFRRQKATQLRLYARILPGNANADADTLNGVRVAKFLGLPESQYKVVPIQSICDANIAADPELFRGDYAQLHLGNLSSEVRAIQLSRVAAKYNCLVLGTGNRDEDYHLGYFTKRGDGAVDKSPIADLAKRHVRQIAAYNGLPHDLVMRTSTAGLWADQTDEKELGFSYIEAEIVVEGKDQKYSRDQLVEICDFGYCRNEKKSGILIVDEVLRMHSLAHHKLESPAVCKISGKK